MTDETEPRRMSACSNPEKARHASERAAWQHVTLAHPEDPSLRPYRCGDHWHVGHRHKTTAKQWMRRHRRNA